MSPTTYPTSQVERLSDVDLREFSHGGWRYSIRAVPAGRGRIPGLAWTRENTEGQVEVMTLRNVIGAVQDYEPARSMTVDAIAFHDPDKEISVASLRAQQAYMDDSALVLNRGLREALLRAVANGVTLSEVACRCERYKTNQKNSKKVGETSWLLRRCGLAVSNGIYTPWIHTDVLALIAREGLGLAPNEVEVGVYDQ